MNNITILQPFFEILYKKLSFFLPSPFTGLNYVFLLYLYTHICIIGNVSAEAGLSYWPCCPCPWTILPLLYFAPTPKCTKRCSTSGIRRLPHIILCVSSDALPFPCSHSCWWRGSYTLKAGNDTESASCFLHYCPNCPGILFIPELSCIPRRTSSSRSLLDSWDYAPLNVMSIHLKGLPSVY